MVYCKDGTSKKLADIDNANSEDFFDFDNDDIQIEIPETALSNEQFHVVKVGKYIVMFTFYIYFLINLIKFA